MTPAQPGRRPRLLIITPDFPPTHGGVQVLVHRLARGMPGFEVEVLALDSPGAARFDRAGQLAEGRLATRRAGAHMPGAHARVVALNAAALARAARLRPQVTLSAHIVASPAAAAIRHLLGARTAQYFYAHEIAGKRRLAAFAAAHADLAIAISSHTASLVAATGAGDESLRVIAPGVDLPSDHPAAIGAEALGGEALQHGRPTVLTVSQLNYRYKGHDVLIRALATVRARVPDLEWVVIGDGPLRAELERLAGSCGLDGTARFLGDVADEQRDLWLRRADLLAMPSRGAGEGFGIAYLEAGAYGKPVVAGDVAGAREAVADGASGILVDPTDPHAVAAAVTRLLLDRGLARRLGRAGAERARQFAWPQTAARVQDALLELVKI